jgi:hypothetical protein
MRKLGFDDLIEPPILAVIWVVLSWAWARGVNRAANLDQLTAFQKIGIVYGAWFFLGLGYILNVAQALRLSEGNWIVLTVGWVAVLSGTGYWRYMRKRW